MIYLERPGEVASIAVSVSVCDGFFSRLVGALPAGRIPSDRGLLFPDCRQIHTWFMRRAIAVVTFDEEGRILSYHPEIAPFRIMPYESRGFGLLELAPGRLEELGGDRGFDRLLLESEVARRAGLPGLEHPDSAGHDRP